MNQKTIDHLFTYHPPSQDQIPKYNELREAAKKFAKTVYRLTPEGEEKKIAIQKIREAVMFANASIACE